MPAEFSNETGHGLLLIPQPPMVRTIFYDNGNKLRLVFPYALFGLFYWKNPQHLPDKSFALKRLHVMFGQQPFTGAEDQKLYGLPLRNHDGAYATCFYKWDGEETEEKFARLIINQYWMSPYAEYHDWASWWTQRYAALNPQFFDEWVAATERKDYKWILEQQLLQAEHHVTVGKLLEANKSHVNAEGVRVVQLITPKVEFGDLGIASIDAR